MDRFIISILWIAGTLIVVNGQAARFPAGVDPRLCPSFPHCDNAILAAFSKNPLPFMKEAYGGGGSGSGRGAGEFEIDHFALTPPGYPVGLSRSACPNYPFCQ